MKRIGLITLLAASALLSAAPAAGAESTAASVTKSAGSVSATLTWKKMAWPTVGGSTARSPGVPRPIGVTIGRVAALVR